MSRFTERLIVSPLEDGKTWVVLNPDFGYEIGHSGSAERIRVPMGFRTDFTSVPWGLRWIIPKWDTHGNAAVLHDWLYWDQGESTLADISTYKLNNRRDCDRVMLEAMEVLGVSPLRSRLIFGVLYLVGGLAWRNNHRRATEGETKVQPVDDLLAILQQTPNTVLPTNQRA